jgi:arsenate reductase (glutaredoxin)
VAGRRAGRLNAYRRAPFAHFGDNACLVFSYRRATMGITIYHNTACGTSRNTLALIRATGVEPEIVDYVKSPPTRAALQQMIAVAGLSVRGAMRDKGDLYDELGLSDLSLSDEALLDAMMAHPILINRPFVVTDKGVRLCRPAELVQQIL